MNSMTKYSHFRKDSVIRSFESDGTFVDAVYTSINEAKRASRAIGLHKVAKVSKLPTER